MDIKKYLGVDIGGTAVKLGIVDENGNILCHSDFSTSFDDYETPVIETVVSGIKDFLAQNTSALSGIGVSATGQVDVESGTIIGVCGSVKNWEGTAIKERFQKEFGLKTTVINDANAVAIAEQRFGSAKGSDDVLVVTVGTGIGGGIISGSRLIMGKRGIGGEIGHITINMDGAECTCGNSGCLEKYASVRALVKNVEVRAGLAERLGMREINGRTIFEHIEDPEIAEIVDRWISCLASGLIGLVHVFNPEVLVIGGGISREKVLFIEPLKEKVLKGVMPRFAEGLSLRQAALGNNAGVMGAVAYYMDTEI